MGESMRCPYCGHTGATRTESVCEYQSPIGRGEPSQRGPLVSQTDRYECEHCRRTWDEVAFPRATGESAANPGLSTGRGGRRGYRLSRAAPGRVHCRYSISPMKAA